MKDLLSLMKEKLASWRHSEGYADVRTPDGEEAEFLLRHDGTRIGRLWIKASCWHFEYYDGFDEDSGVKPLIQFPDTDKKYKTRDLWPFFALRIPSPKQPSVRKVVEDEEIDVENEVELLRRFGRKTSDNPFLLEPVA